MYVNFRPFEDTWINTIQTDAIKSWLSLNPRPEIIAIGNDPGVKETCEEYNLIHVPSIKTAKSGASYLNKLIQRAEKRATNDIMLLISGDIMVDQTTIKAAEALKESGMTKFCLCARKRNMKRQPDGTFTKNNWCLWQAGDYFMHSRGMFESMPDFIVGRRALDNWMYRHCIANDALIDGSGVITVWHQQHERQHELRKEEINHNIRLYKENFVDLPKWQNEPWYKKNRLLEVEIRYANYRMLGNYSIIDNTSPDRGEFE